MPQGSLVKVKFGDQVYEVGWSLQMRVAEAIQAAQGQGLKLPVRWRWKIGSVSGMQGQTRNYVNLGDTIEISSMEIL